MIDDEKDLIEVLLGHDELSDDESIGDLLGADPDPEAKEDEMIDLNSIAFEDGEEEEEDDDFEDDEEEEEDDDDFEDEEEDDDGF